MKWFHTLDRNPKPHLKISSRTIHVFIREFYKNGIDEHQRIGQAFCNRFLPTGELYDELFYADNGSALEMIYKRHVS